MSRLLPTLALVTTISSAAVAWAESPGRDGGAARDAGAPPSPGDRPVEVIAPRCPSSAVSFAEVVDLLQVELAASGTRCCRTGRGNASASERDGGSTSTDERPVVRVEVEVDPCEPEATRMVVVVRRHEQPAVRRAVLLSDVAPATRARALALAIAELIRPSPRHTTPPAFAPDPNAPAAPAPPPAPSSPPRITTAAPPAAPAPRPAPLPTPAPRPAPLPTPAPRPAPLPTPAPAPAPTPPPAPAPPTPAPAPRTTPTPAPRPAPELTPAPMPTPALALAPISRGAAAADTAESSTARQAGTVSKPAPAAGGGSPALDVLAAAELHRYTGSAVTLWGGRAAIAFRRGRWHAGADAGGATGDGEAALGTIAVKSADAGVSFGPHTRFGWLGAAADLRGALGWAWVAGRSPVSADIATGAGSGLTATAGVRLSLAAPIAGALQARAFVESGAVLRGVDGLSDGRSFAGVHDGYVTVGIGAGWTRD